MTYFHIYADTPDGRLPFTYIVFGPYANGTEWDVEVHRDHVENNGASGTYLFTQSDLSRDTHIVGDMIDPMRQWIDSYYYSGV